MIEIRHVRFDRLSPQGRRSLFDEMTSVVASSITPGSSLEHSWAARDWSRRRDAVVSHSLACVAREDGMLVGFVTYRMEALAGRPLLHLQVACVAPTHQAGGLGFQMTARILFRALRRRPWAGLYVGGHVINPVALRGWMMRVRDSRSCYPRIGDVAPPNDSLVSAACEMAECHDPGLAFDKTTGVVAGKHLPGPRPPTSSGDRDFDDHYARYVDPGRGDSVLMLLDLSRTVILSHLPDLTRAAWRMVRPHRGGGRSPRRR